MAENAGVLHQGNYSVASRDYIVYGPRRPRPCQHTTRDLPSVCRVCGTWCGSFLTADGPCPLFNRVGCILRHDARFREATA